MEEEYKEQSLAMARRREEKKGQALTFIPGEKSKDRLLRLFPEVKKFRSDPE
jgi:hypothetical protein